MQSVFEFGLPLYHTDSVVAALLPNVLTGRAPCLLPAGLGTIWSAKLVSNDAVDSISSKRATASTAQQPHPAGLLLPVILRGPDSAASSVKQPSGGTQQPLQQSWLFEGAIADTVRAAAKSSALHVRAASTSSAAAASNAAGGENAEAGGLLCSRLDCGSREHLLQTDHPEFARGGRHLAAVINATIDSWVAAHIHPATW